MFTGIIQEIGCVEKIARGNSLITFGIKSFLVSKEAKISDSIAVNGVCLTLVNKDKDVLFFETVPSTLENTNLKRLKKGDCVNIESALAIGDKLGGHFVLGHVDIELKLRRIIKKTSHWYLEIDLPPQFKKFVIANGSVTVEGISLTIKKVLPRSFTLDIVPFTYNNTVLKNRRIGAWLNLEFDYLLKQQIAGK